MLSASKDLDVDLFFLSFLRKGSCGDGKKTNPVHNVRLNLFDLKIFWHMAILNWVLVCCYGQNSSVLLIDSHFGPFFFEFLVRSASHSRSPVECNASIELAHTIHMPWTVHIFGKLKGKDKKKHTHTHARARSTAQNNDIYQFDWLIELIRRPRSICIYLVVIKICVLARRKHNAPNKKKNIYAQTELNMELIR